jgi:glutathione S-transferase
MPMLIVHHLNNSRSQRILWLLAELDVQHEVKRYARDPATMAAPPSLLAVHPLGKSPIVTDDGNVIAETGAIVEYILSKYGNGRLMPPPGGQDRLRYTYWMHFAEGSAMPPLVMTLLFTELPKRTPALVRPIARMIARTVQTSYLAPQIERQLDLMETELGRSAWFAGPDITGADVLMSFPVEAAASRMSLGARPRLTQWLRTIHARPAYQRALQEGGPYAYA